MKDLSKIIVEKIKKAHVKPESKYKLQWKSYLFWFIMVCLVFLGALSLSMVIFNLIDIHPLFLRYLGLHKFLRIFFITAPYLWILLSLSALVFGILAFRKTSRGYRHSTLFIASLVVLIISILGVFIHALNINKQMNGLILKGAPNFRNFTQPRDPRWQRPMDGLIGGEITNTYQDSFELRSFDNENWKIIHDQKTKIFNNTSISSGKKVGVIGEKTEELTMRAFLIRQFPDDWDGQPPSFPPGQTGDLPDGPPPFPPPNFIEMPR